MSSCADGRALDVVDQNDRLLGGRRLDAAGRRLALGEAVQGPARGGPFGEGREKFDPERSGVCAADWDGAPVWSALAVDDRYQKREDPEGENEKGGEPCRLSRLDGNAEVIWVWLVHG